MKKEKILLYPIPTMDGFYVSPQDNDHLLIKSNAVKKIKPHRKTKLILKQKGIFDHEKGR